MAEDPRLALDRLGEQAYRYRSSGRTEAGMWGIIKKIKVFGCLEKERLGEARSVLAPFRRRAA